MSFLSAEAQAVLKRHPVILATSRGLILPRTDHNTSYLQPGDGVSETEFVDLLLGMCPIKTLTMYSWNFKRVSPENLARLDSAGVFTDLEDWYIGWNGRFTVRGMFELLSIMPNLKRLLVGNVHGGQDTEETEQAESSPDEDTENDSTASNNDDGEAGPEPSENTDPAREKDDTTSDGSSSDHAEIDSSPSDTESSTPEPITNWKSIPGLPTPACSLTHLVVSDDWGIDFMEYDALLSRSHESLVHVEGHWIFESEPGDQLAIALKKCKRVQSLTVIGCSFDNERLVKVCPKLRRLEVESVRTEFGSAWEEVPDVEEEEVPMNPLSHLLPSESSEAEAVSVDDDDDENSASSSSDSSTAYALSSSKLTSLLPPLLSELVLVDCRPSTGPEFITQSWEDSIAHVLPLRPRLQNVRIVTRKSWQEEVRNQSSDDGKKYWEMRGALRMARVKLSMSDKHVLY